MYSFCDLPIKLTYIYYILQDEDIDDQQYRNKKPTSAPAAALKEIVQVINQILKFSKSSYKLILHFLMLYSLNFIYG